jgi:ATP-dependent helicase/DNAse subunit B
MIKLLFGPYRTGKTGLLLKELAEYKLENSLSPCLILVPSRRYGSLVRKQLAEQAKPAGMQGVFGLQIATIYEISNRILTQAGLAPNILPQQLCVRVVADVLHSMHAEKQLVHLEPIYDLPGTAAALYRLIDEFERAAVTPSDAIKSVNATASNESRHQELATVYKRFWLRLDELGCVDEKRMVLNCRDLLAKKSVAGLNLKFVAMDGFDRISPLQAEIVQGLSNHAAETRISFDYVAPERRLQAAARDDEYSWKDASYGELKSRLEMTEQFVELPGPPTRPQPSSFTALELFAECQEAARRCKQAIIERGVSPEQILVVARDIKEYACAINLSFRQAGLPIFIDESGDVASVPSIKVLLETLELAANDFPRRGVIDVLRSRYINTDRFEWSAADLDRLEKNSFKVDLISGVSQWRHAFSANVDLLKGLEEFFKAVTPPAAATRTAYCRWLEDMIENVFVAFSKKQPSKAQPGGRVIVMPSNADVQALAALRTAIKTMITEEVFFGAHEISFEAFLSNVRSMLEGATFRASRPVGDCISVSSAEQAPNRRFDEVFVLGATEGRFPRHSAEAGFASSDERARWRMFGIVLNNPREEPGYERALFASLTDRARKRFHISFPQVNLGGDEVFPSFYLSDGTLQSHCSAAADGQVENTDFAALALSRPASPSEAAFGWLWRKHSFSLPEEWLQREDVSEYWTTMSSTVYGAYQRHAPAGGDEFRGDLTAHVEGAFIESKVPPVWSVSALNTYGQCPFRYWVERSLGIDAVEEPQSGLDTKERGKVYHRILELYYQKLMADGLSPPDRVHEAQMQEALQETFKQWEERPFFRPGPYWQNQKSEMAFRVRNFLEFDWRRIQKENRVPLLLEASFGMHDSKYGALRCHTSAGDVLIRGVIDRVDVQRQGDVVHASVIDYKSGSRQITAHDARAGANMQLPVYAMAVEQSIIPGSIVDDGAYLAIQAAKSINTLTFREGDTSDVLQKVQERIDDTVRGVSSGRFPVEPYTKKACEFCDHESICRVKDLRPTEDKDENA